MKLLVQPGDGMLSLIKAINNARSRVEIAIFRFDRREIERALANAVSRGVFVQALIAYTNRGGEKKLRDLEMRLLAAGVTVARTANDLLRYHDKFVIIDRRELYMLAYNFTYLDIEHSRSFGIVTRERRVVQEAVRLFEADTKRQPYVPGLPSFVVSPENARRQLAALIRGAKKELLIYDPEISDPAMIRLLDERARAGVRIRVIGRLSRKNPRMEVRKLSGLRLHTRTILIDGRRAFIGSQSLREVELDRRRELGIILRDARIVNRLIATFQQDWETTKQAGMRDEKEDIEPAMKVARKVAKAVARELPAVTPVVEMAVKEVVGENTDLPLVAEDVEESVKDAVKEAVKEAVINVVEEVAESRAHGGK